MENLRGKKLLILASGGSHCKLVRAAQELEVYTIVVDNLEPSIAAPAKVIADENWMISILDTEDIIEKCKKEHIDGVLGCWSDISQLPYYKICNALGLPCHGSEELFFKMTNKKAFKQMCYENDVDVIEEYSKEDVELGNIKYPVFVKPVDSRGSKGQSVCNNYEELKKAIIYAESASISKDIIIEHYVANKNSFQVTYFFSNGEPKVIRTADGYKGTLSDKLDRVALCSISPSTLTKEYFNKANNKFINMLKKLGYTDGPAMVQGFYDDGIFRFYDPGLRFPGTDYELMYRAVYGIDLMKMMVVYALTGHMPAVEIPDESVYLRGKKAAILFPTLSAGKVSKIKGLKELENNSKVYSIHPRYDVGDTVEWTYTTRQRLAEIDFLSEDMQDLRNTIRYFQKIIDVRDIEGNDMIYMPFDTERLK